MALQPFPNGPDRKDAAQGVREKAADLRGFDHPAHDANTDIDALAPQVPSTFTKGLPHDKFGVVEPGKLDPYVTFINQDTLPDGTPRPADRFEYADPKGDKVDLGPSSGTFEDTSAKVRAWESPLAGHTFDLEGPDAGAVTMPPAPALGSEELTAEMAEVYALALLRDFPFSAIETGGTSSFKPAGTPQTSQAVFDAVNGLGWFTKPDTSSGFAERRREARLDGNGHFTPKAAYRGSTRGAMVGPYLSQFMLIGNAARQEPSGGAESAAIDNKAQGAFNLRPMLAIGEEGIASAGEEAGLIDPKLRKAKDGFIQYGTQEINQRSLVHKIGKDYMSDWASWYDVQNGANYKGRDAFEGGRFITTPRDLASYVHFDALYQAYLNACLILFGYGHPLDSGLPTGGHHVKRDAFATFGPPHLLSLVTEVASRALKFARRQKFNVHLRARPEAIAGVITLAAHDAHKGHLGAAQPKAEKMLHALKHCGLLDMVRDRNKVVSGNDSGTDNWIDAHSNFLLPMAFPEGSPMHPSYAAGHATVAGACVTILKAFFEMFETPTGWKEKPFVSIYGDNPSDVIGEAAQSCIFEPDEEGNHLRQVPHDRADADKVTVQGELDKLAANISIGRDMAGVHYYTDYYESLRMGERVAVGILQEQMLTYPEKVKMRLKTFDGEKMEIIGHGDGETVKVKVDGSAAKFKPWFERATDPGAALHSTSEEAA